MEIVERCIKGISKSHDALDLKDILDRYGFLLRIRLLQNSDGPGHIGTGFVTFRLEGLA